MDETFTVPDDCFGLRGLARALYKACCITKIQSCPMGGDHLHVLLRLPPNKAHLANSSDGTKIANAMSKYYGRGIQISIEEGYIN